MTLTTNILRELKRIADKKCCPPSPYPVAGQPGLNPEYGGISYVDPDICRLGALFLNTWDAVLGELALPLQAFDLGVALSLVMTGQPQYIVLALLSLATTDFSSTPDSTVVHSWLLSNRSGLLSDITSEENSADAKIAIDARIDASALSDVLKEFTKIMLTAGDAPFTKQEGLNSVYALQFDVFAESDISWASCPGQELSIFFKMVGGAILVGDADVFEAVPGHWLLQGVDHSIYFASPAYDGAFYLAGAVTDAGGNVEVWLLLGDGTEELNGSFSLSGVPDVGQNWSASGSNVAIGIKLVRPGGAQGIKISSILVDNSSLS